MQQPWNIKTPPGMAQVVATIAYGIRGLRRGETTWGWPDFNADPEQENLAQLSRWSLNSAPAWDFPPLAIANQYHDQQANEVKRARYRLILVRGSDLRWLNRDRLQEVKTGLAKQHKWIPVQHLPFPEVVLYAYAADRTPFPTYVCLPSGLYKARTGQVVAQTGPEQEILSLPGMYFFDGWRVHPTLPIPDHLPRAREAPVLDIAQTAPTPGTEPIRSPEEEARDILATAAKNQPEDGPNTRRAAVRACKYLRAMVNQYESTIQAVHIAARTHTQKSKGAVGPAVDCRPQGEALPVISSDLTSELLHCLSTLPDPWPLAKITIDMEKPSQWVSKLCRLYFADEYARRTVGLPSPTHVPDIAAALRAVQTILPKLEVKLIEFLAEWLVTLLIPASHVLEVRAPHLSFMLLKEYWFRELHPRLESHSIFRPHRIIHQSNPWSGKMHHARSQATESAGHLERAVYHSVRAGMDDPTSIPQPAQRKHQNRKFRQSHRRPVGPPHLFFPSDAFVASARSFNMFKSMLQLELID